MKLKYWVKYCIILIVFFTSSCVSTRVTNTPVRNETKPTVTLAEWPIATQHPARTSENLTATASIQPTLTSSPFLLKATMTPVATLKADQTREIVKAFLQDGGNCAAPCFMGIMPGKSTLDEAEAILIHLGLPLTKITNQGQDFYDTDYDFENGLSFSGHLAAQDALIMNIKIGINQDPTRAEFPRDWLAFSPETLISFYGQPSRVSFATDWGPRSYFEMNLYFDTVDLIVEYTGYDLITKEKGGGLICPLSMPFDSIGIWMGKDPIYPPLAAAPLEKATAMTIEEFTQLMTGNPDQACFTLINDESP